MKMRENHQQWSRRLLRAWALLVGLTLVSLVAVLGFGHSEAGLLAVMVALGASFFKARAVLDHFLDLRRAGTGWRSFFYGSLILILLVLLATYIAAEK
ncbi:cytochrome C oxidase subunit IV family protein [Magnetospirillum sulfuroxidans]|uniref:Cytochrome C oxidase subunit IV family protein n=1 Tax=Magnetospirillum sulfuroxidans TaxID=611300 RepID=A0ABS5I8N1_9PROT|nr:cytochrome C oxidase subunit IV family protein [Magnetospirillum sulfuroxidans]MBR9970796.1 cytochrome C oxidase subunit IV family protein [Magnetospirillum sulfuroxidans]